MKERIRHQHSCFRLRSFWCKRCHLHVQFFGNDPITGKCHCCNTPIADLVLESDHLIETKKTITNLLMEK